MHVLGLLLIFYDWFTAWLSAGLTARCIQKCIKLCGLLQNHERQLMCHALFVIHVLHGAGLMALVAGLFNALTLYAQFAHDSGEVIFNLGLVLYNMVPPNVCC
ncbi:unnamed protein product [Lathyrus oleraceus]